MTESQFLREMDSLKPRRYHYFITALSDMGYFLDGYDLLVIGPALFFIGPLFGLTNAMLALVGVATIIGQLVGGAIFGFVADLKGRKLIYQWDMLIFAAFAILCAVSANAGELIAFRTLLGLAIGADYALTLSIIGEFAPVKSRGKLLGTGLMSWWIGGATAVALGLALLPVGANAWRFLLAAGAVPAVIVLILRRQVEETPRFADEKNDAKEITEIKKRFHMTAKEESTLYEETNASKNINYKKRAIFTYTAWFLNDLIFYGVGIYTVYLMVELGLSSYSSALKLTLLLYMIGIVGTVVFVFTADIIGRKKWQAYTFLAQGVALLILGLFFLVTGKPAPLLLLFPMFAIFYFANAGGTGQTTGIFVSELFPTRMRTTAMGAGTAISRVGAIISAVVFPITLHIYGIVPMEILLFFVGLSGFLVTIFLGEETKNRSLEGISS